ncbi:Cytochrome P450 monooxygenase ORF6-like protein [Cladobotryum mycophilum]|uniref:ribonuclease H n=1 Tax=Cladobotryum mycophilum TaxID=491253 RepID=A0ABR0SNT1_9HYPO
MILQLLLTSVLAYTLWSLVCLESNVRKARAIGLPVVRIPVDGMNIPWQTFQSLIWSILDRLPISWSSYPDWVRFIRRGWYFADKSETHVRLGPVWALVTPAAIHIHFADPEAVQEIYSRREEFVRPVKEYKLLEVYGPCISSAGWDDWARHRKPLAAPFNESVMKFVWEESLNQAQAMFCSWTGASAVASGIPSVQKDMRTLSLNVLAAISFRKSYNFHGSADEPIVGEELSYRDALQTVLDGVILLMLVPIRVLTAPMMPKSWVKIGRAAQAFKRYMEQMLQNLALARILGAFKRSPYKALELEAAIPRLKLGSKKPALTSLDKAIGKYERIERQDLVWQAPWNKEPKATILISQASKKEAKKQHLQLLEDLTFDNYRAFYTDGSQGTHKGTVTNSCAYYEDSPSRQNEAAKTARVARFWNLGPYIEVADAELIAISKVLDALLLSRTNQPTAYIFVDSQAAIMKIKGPGEISYRIRAQLYLLSQQSIAITVAWVPSHTGIPGNEIADQLAKKGLEASYRGRPYQGPRKALQKALGPGAQLTLQKLFTTKLGKEALIGFLTSTKICTRSWFLEE